jgi:precorrin-6x reductase
MASDKTAPGGVRVIPGVTAAQAAGVSIGAPYSNGLVLVSLSDYLQPWRDVVKSLEGARESGLSVAVYNPVLRGLPEKIAALRNIFRGRTAILARDAGRAGETTLEMPVGELDENSIDMRTVIFILSPKAKEKYIGEKKIWIEARGYGSEMSGGPDVTGQFLVLGGTTEGREAASCLLKAGFSVSVSVTREAGLATVPDGASALTGARDFRRWIDLFEASKPGRGPLGVVDATHPFASEASREITMACGSSGLPLCRFARREETPDGAVITGSLEEAARKAVELTLEGEVVFLAIGTNGLREVLPILREAGRGVLARMLPTRESLELAERAGIGPRDIVAAWGPGGADFNEALCRDRGVRCIVSRDSGAPGGLSGKSEAASRLDIPLVLISRPPVEPGVTLVNDCDELLRWCGELSAERK